MIFVHGFASTTIGYRYKNFVDYFKGKINLFRFDFSGCGLSDGDFSDLTINKQTKELEKAIKVFQKKGSLKEINIMAHSLGGCVILNFLLKKRKDIKRVVFFAPAFNQRELQKYFFVEKFKKGNINWKNFKKYFSEKNFLNYLTKDKKIMLSKCYLNSECILEMRNIDYQTWFKNIEFDLKNILVVHGLKDDVVPLESNDILPKELKIIKVLQGDHVLQRPDMVKEYFKKVINFLK